MKKPVALFVIALAVIYIGIVLFDAGRSTDDVVSKQPGLVKVDSMELNNGAETMKNNAGEKMLDSEMRSDEKGAGLTGSQHQTLEPEILESVRELVDTSHEGLEEKKTANGVALRLNGKFRTAPVATIDENGELTVRDYTSPPTE